MYSYQIQILDPSVKRHKSRGSTFQIDPELRTLRVETATRTAPPVQAQYSEISSAPFERNTAQVSLPLDRYTKAYCRLRKQQD